MTLKETLRRAAENLASHDIEDARLEAELLLMHILGIGRAQLYVQLEQELSNAHSQALVGLAKRRIRREPTAYIIGRKEFFGLDFYVDPGVLIPRPESELLVEKALQFVKARSSCLLADIGTGCGAIAISLALHLPQATIYATDISAKALEVAAINCQKHRVANRVHLLECDMLELIPEPVDVIVANLPYVKESDFGELSPEIRLFEPMLALKGGDNGLDMISQLLSQAEAKLRQGGVVLVEIGPQQGQAVTRLARDRFPNAKVGLLQDLGGLDRVVSIET